jgi:hypothetical protein
VAHACNPSYSEGRDQEDQISKSAQANSSQDPTPQGKKKKSQKRAGEVTQGVDPEFKPQYHKKKKKKKDLIFFPPIHNIPFIIYQMTLLRVVLF